MRKKTSKEEGRLEEKEVRREGGREGGSKEKNGEEE